LNNYITRDPGEWFEFDAARLGVDYVAWTIIGGRSTPQVRVDYGLLPAEGANATIDDGNFILSLRCSQRSRLDAFTAAQNKAKNAFAENSGAALDPIRYMKTYTGHINCQFFGSIPIPGMWGRATIPGGAEVLVLDASGNVVRDRVPLSGDMVVEGVIESVQFSFPGILSVQVAQYAKVNFGESPSNNLSIYKITSQGALI
jgi:hypothetical protein